MRRFAALPGSADFARNLVSSDSSVLSPAWPSPLGRQIHFAPRTLIFLEGDEGQSIFQVLHGSVMLYKLLPDGRRQVVEVLAAGDVFGFSRARVRTSSAETLAATRCLVMRREFIEQSPVLSQWLNARLLSQLCALQEHITLLGRKSATERVTSFLIRFIPGRGDHDCLGPQVSEDDASVRLTMTRQEIADYLGLMIETVSRVLTRLKRCGLLTISRLDEIYVRDVCCLCRLTGAQWTTHRQCSARVEGKALALQSRKAPRR